LIFLKLQNELLYYSVSENRGLTLQKNNAKKLCLTAVDYMKPNYGTKFEKVSIKSTFVSIQHKKAKYSWNLRVPSIDFFK
jgi:hypothetical protein